MKWSQLPRRKKSLYLTVGLAAVALIVTLSLLGGNTSKPQADLPSNAPQLDNGVPSTDVFFMTSDSAGKPMAANLDILPLNGGEAGGYLGQTGPTGLTSLTMNDGCYTAQASAISGSAKGSQLIAVGAVDPASCGQSPTVVAKSNPTKPVTITLK